MQEAYDSGLLAIDDLKNIAYYQNGASEDENFTVTPKTPETLSEKTENAIKKTKAYDLRHCSNPKKANADDVTIHKYYGTYNGCVALMLTTCYECYNDAVWEIEIEGVLFQYSNGNRIYIWK